MGGARGHVARWCLAISDGDADTVHMTKASLGAQRPHLTPEPPVQPEGATRLPPRRQEG